MNRRLDTSPSGGSARRATGLPMDQRQLDQLVKVIADELDRRSGTSGRSASNGGPTLGNVALVDNWRVRATHRREFLDYYIANVAEVVSSMPGYVSGRVLATQNDAPYSWQVQAFYEFTSSDVVNSFKTEYDRALRKVKSGMTMEKVLDAMDPWVLAHEDGVLETVWQ